MYKVTFTHDLDKFQSVTITAKAHDVDSYGADNLVILFDDEELGKEIKSDKIVMSEIIELANEHLYNKKYADELVFEER
jgi:hypothetical protein